MSPPNFHPADQGDTATLPTILMATAENPAELVADKGYHSRHGLKNLADSEWKTRISEKKANGFSRWNGNDQARRAVTNNRARLLSGVAR